MGIGLAASPNPHFFGLNPLIHANLREFHLFQPFRLARMSEDERIIFGKLI